MSSRVTLRPLRSSDAEAFMSWGGDPQVTQSLFWDHYADVEEARSFLESVANSHRWFMAICLDDKPIGAITLDIGVNRAVKRAELGYVVARKCWGKGYATAAVRLALQHGFEDLRINRIEALVDPENLGSVHVLEKAGLIREGHLKSYVVHRGHLKDRYIYALTR